jgi:hypothetical protein
MTKDHLGHTFPSVQAMFLFWGLKEWEYYERKWAGWSLEQILTTSHKIRPDKDGKPIEKPIRPNAQHRLISTTRKRIEGGQVTIREYQRG